jgi:hypothetical protein
MLKPTNDARLSRGPFETHSDRLDLRALLSEYPQEPEPLRHPSAWLGGGDADLPDPVAL